MVNSWFVAINIVFNEGDIQTLLNDNIGYPIIFYWNGIDDIFNVICNDVKFNEILNNYVFNYKTYHNTSLKLTYINTDNENICTEKEVTIQELFPLSILNMDFMYSYLNDILIDLHKKFFKTDYNIDDIEIDPKNIIKDIFFKIKNNDKREILQDTIVNYIRNKLSDIKNLSKENKEYLIEILLEIIRES
jgi:hypothetical protein